MSRRSAAVQERAVEMMRDRRVLSASEFGSQFFPPEQSRIATQLREILKDVLIVDVSRIHPDDRLVEDLGLGQVDGLAQNFLEQDVDDRFGVSLRPAWSSIKTVRDLVAYVSSAYRETR
jgi:acyl carrier protein